MTKDIKYILTEKEHDELKYKLELLENSIRKKEKDFIIKIGQNQK